MNDKFKLRCDTCDYIWEQETESLMKIKWICPECGSDDRIFIIEYTPSDEDFYKKETGLGRGGALSAKW